MAKRSSDEDFIEAWKRSGGQARQVGLLLNISERAAYERRNKLEERYGLKLPSGGNSNGTKRGDAGEEAGPVNDYLQRVTIDGFTGCLIVSSDHHYWPGQGPSLAHRAL